MKYQSNYMLIFKNSESMKNIIDKIDKDENFSKIIDNVYIINESKVDNTLMMAEIFKYVHEIKKENEKENVIMIRLTDLNII